MADKPAHLPPQALDAERAVLGSMLIERDAVEKAIDALSDRDFYLDAHRKVFAAMSELYAHGDAVDMITVGERLKRAGELDGIGGMDFLTQLVHAVATAAHVDYYAKIVKDKSILRDLISTATSIVTQAYASAEETSDLLDQAQAAVLKIAERQEMQGVVDAGDLAHEVIEIVEQKSKDKRNITGVPSGLRDLDRCTSGFQPSDLILLAARPSQGKTALALTFAMNISVDKKIPTLVFSMEMSRHAIMERLIASRAGIDLMRVRNGSFPRDKWTSLTNAAAEFSESPLQIVDMPGLSVLQVRSISRQVAAEWRRKGQQLGIILIDYLQLMRGSSNRTESRQQEVSEISRGLKFLARDLNVPVIALSQLSRRTEEKGRVDAKPQLSDLRESGALEQDADLVMFIYRESYYKRNDPTVDEKKAEIIIAKQRQGPTDTVEAQFLRNITRFVDAAPSDVQEPIEDIVPAQATFDA